MSSVCQIKFTDNPAIPGIDRLSDETFLQAIVWRRGTPAPLRQAAASGGGPAFVRVWSDLLHERLSQHKAVHPDFAVSALWSESAFGEVSARTEQILRSLATCQRMEQADLPSRRAMHTPANRSRPASDITSVAGRASRKFERFLSSLDDGDGPSAVELLAILQALMLLTSSLEPVIAWRLWRAVFSASLVFGSDGTQDRDKTLSADQQLVLNAELPWQIGLLFSDIDGATSRSRAGRELANSELLDHTDEDGTPKADLLDRFPCWLASLVRCADSAERFGKRLWTSEARRRLASLVRVVAPFCLSDGQIALSRDTGSTTVSIVRAATQLAGLAADTHPHRFLLGVDPTTADRRSKRGDGAETGQKDETPLATQSDWAQVACLRSDWTPGAGTVVVAHDRPIPRIHVAADGKSLVSGDWGLSVSIDGSLQSFSNNWECVCWHSDEDADFLELQVQQQGFRIERHVLLSRTDNFLLLADALSADRECRIDYESSLSLNGRISAEPAFEWREYALRRGRQCAARVYPVALPRDRMVEASGELTDEEDQLVLRQTVVSDGLYVPLVVDWEPRRRFRSAEWRTLTVSEAGRAVSSGVASGHRLQIGDLHLLIYRSLKKAPGASRSVLGHHTRYETVVGKFDGTGEVKPVLLVE